VKQAAPLIMTLPHIKRFSVLLLGDLALFALATSAMADQVSREQDIVDLRLGQRIQVDDGSCPAAQDDADSLGGTGDPLRAAVAPRSVYSNELIDAER
jgi:hypothetical protein